MLPASLSHLFADSQSNAVVSESRVTPWFFNYLMSDFRFKEEQPSKAEIEQQILEGGSAGVVRVGIVQKRAGILRPGQPVAVKFRYNPEDKEKARLQREHSCCMIPHLNLVHYFGMVWNVMKEKGMNEVRTPGIVMENLPGHSLERWLKELLKRDSEPTLEDMRFIMRALQDVCCGVDFLHTFEAPAVHGELKVSNCILGEDGTCKVANFCLVPFSNINLSPTVAPEVTRGAFHSPESDMWQFGTLLDDVCTPFLARGAFPDVMAELSELAKECSAESMSERPSFSAVYARIVDIDSRLVSRKPLSYRLQMRVALAAAGDSVDDLVEAASETDGMDRSVLLWASHLGDDRLLGRVLERLLKKLGQKATTALLETGDYWGMRPVHLAGRNGHSAVLRLLWQYGVDLSVADDLYGNTSIHYAMQGGHMEAFRFLVERAQRARDWWNKTGYTPLVVATYENSREMLESLLQYNEVRIDRQSTSQRMSALAVACREGRLLAAECLLQHGSDVDAPDKNGSTPLAWAATNGHLEIVEMLLRNGANPHHTDRSGGTALAWSSTNGHEAIVRLLVAHGVNVNSTDKDKRAPLDWACSKGHMAIARFLIEEGASIDHADSKGGTPLLWASGNGHLEVVQLLVSHGVDVNRTDKDRRAPIDWAASKGHLGIVQALIANGARVDHTDRMGGTPLLFAAQNGRTRVVKVLLQHGASVQHADAKGGTALAWSATNGHVEVVQMLLEYSADPNHTDRSGGTALAWSVTNNHMDIVRLLVAAGAAVNSKDMVGRIPLDWAASKGHEEIAQVLVAHGADVNHSDSRGGTPLIWSCGNGHFGVAKLLLSAGANVNHQDRKLATALLWASGNGYTEVVSLLLDYDASVDLADARGSTPLDWAASKGHEDTVRLLIARGADVNHVDHLGGGALSFASRQGSLTCVKLLLEAGALVTAADKEGDTALHYAASAGKAEVCSVLLAAGADVNAISHHNRAPLDRAAHGQHVAVTLLLKKAGGLNGREILGEDYIHIPFLEESTIIERAGPEEFQFRAGAVEPTVQGGREVCRQFLRGQCAYRNCKFAHPAQDKAPSPQITSSQPVVTVTATRKRYPCKFWVSRRQCRWGNKCRFLHN